MSNDEKIVVKVVGKEEEYADYVESLREAGYPEGEIASWEAWIAHEEELEDEEDDEYTNHPEYNDPEPGYGWCEQCGYEHYDGKHFSQNGSEEEGS